MEEDKDCGMYGLLCKERFDKIDKMQDKILSVLKGDGEKAGLCEQVRSNKKVCNILIAVIGLLSTAIIVRGVDLIFEWIKKSGT